MPQPFPGNRIPADRIDPVARNLLQYMVAPNTTPDAPLNNFFSANNSRFDTYTSGITRVDHNFGANHRFFARYGHNGRRETRAKSGREEEALTAGYHHRWNNVLSVDLTSTLAADAARRARAPAGRGTAGSTSAARRTRAGSTWPRSASRRTYTSALPGRFPPIRVNDYAGAVDRPGRRTGRSERRLLRAGSPDQDRRASHQLKFGGEFRYGISTVENPLAGDQPREPAVLAQLHVAAPERRAR